MCLQHVNIAPSKRVSFAFRSGIGDFVFNGRLQLRNPLNGIKVKEILFWKQSTLSLTVKSRAQVDY